MANREELLIIRAARTGQAIAQLALGKRYLFGGAGLPQSYATALHWLERAAEQNQEGAWLLIGEHIPFEVALHASDTRRVGLWYERAFEAGSAKAGLVLAMLVFSAWERSDNSLRQKAMRALQMAAEAGLADAQWLLAQQLGSGRWRAWRRCLGSRPESLLVQFHERVKKQAGFHRRVINQTQAFPQFGQQFGHQFGQLAKVLPGQLGLGAP